MQSDVNYSDEFITICRREMKKRGWRNADLARASGVDHTFLSRRFRGVGHDGFTFERAMKLAAALNITDFSIVTKANPLPTGNAKKVSDKNEVN